VDESLDDSVDETFLGKVNSAVRMALDVYTKKAGEVIFFF
jgi:hypothetical protein